MAPNIKKNPQKMETDATIRTQPEKKPSKKPQNMIIIPAIPNTPPMKLREEAVMCFEFAFMVLERMHFDRRLRSSATTDDIRLNLPYIARSFWSL